MTIPVRLIAKIVMSTDGLKSKLKPGDTVWCRVQSSEPGGYLVVLTPGEIEAFMPSHDPIETGRVVPATFVCMNGDQALLTYAFVLGTTARVQVSTASDKEVAFAVWADSYPNAIRPRRAVDLFMPPVDSVPMLLKSGEKKAREIFTSLEAAEFTGCVKVFCQERLSRSAVIFHRGRAVGSVYTTKKVVDRYSFEVGLKKMLEDVTTADTDLEIYELPGDLILSMSALFLGYVDNPEGDCTNAEYAEKMLAHLSSRGETACFSLLEESLAPSALAFFCKGEFKGTYIISERLYSDKMTFLQTLLSEQPGKKLLVHILPSVMMTDSVRFGHSLSSNQFAVAEDDLK